MKDNIYKILEKRLGHEVSKYRDEWNSAGSVDLPYPLHLNIELNFGCNLKCAFCPHSLPIAEWSYDPAPGKRISFDKYCEIIDEGASMGLKSVCLNGNNEPLVKKDIDKYIRYAVSKGILEVSLHTNALLLDEEMSKKIADSGLTIIMFSIDAFAADTYEKIRGSKEYDRVMHNIDNFLKMKGNLPLTKVSFVKNKVNEDEVEEFVSYWEKRVDKIEIQSFSNLFIGHPLCDEKSDKFHLEDVSMGDCYDPWRRLSIQNNGNVFPCCSTYGNEVVVGNIYNNSILEMWNSKKFREIRDRINNDNQPYGCKKCRNSLLRDRGVL